LYNQSKVALEVKNGVGKVKVSLKPLESFVYKM